MSGPMATLRQQALKNFIAEWEKRLEDRKAADADSGPGIFLGQGYASGVKAVLSELKGVMTACRVDDTHTDFMVFRPDRPGEWDTTRGELRIEVMHTPRERISKGGSWENYNPATTKARVRVMPGGENGNASYVLDAWVEETEDADDES